MKTNPKFIQGRGAQINTPNPYENLNYVSDDTELSCSPEKTIFISTHPKTAVNKVTSPDLHFDYSINPYQGCEHGCVYCYARNTHPYWGYSAGLDFESKILYKSEAPALLAKQLANKKWTASEIMLSGNTDCYQPIEKKLEITRRLLETFWKFRHPVGIITKNSLILRDLDLLKKLSAKRLVRVAISITTEDETIRSMMEPRTATFKKRLEVIKTLRNNDIPVIAMMAPVIPGLTDVEIIPIAKKTADAGALDFRHNVVRLSKDVATIFEDWLERKMPERKQKILSQIRSCHEGRLTGIKWSERMKGTGNISQMIKDQVMLARRMYFNNRKMPAYNFDIHQQYKQGQLSLF